MKTKNNIFLLFICLGCFVVSAYGEELPDTFYIKMADIVYTDILYYEDISAMRIRDSIENPKAYLIDSEDGVTIAIEKENKYVTFRLCQPSFGFCQKSNYDYCTFERKNINNTGNEELIIRWFQRDGRSYSTNGFSVYYSGILVWDIDSYKCLLDLETCFSSDEYWQTFDSDTGIYKDSGNRVECYKYNVELEKMQLTIQKDEDCSEVFGKKHIYKLTEFGFVLDRIEE